MFKNLSQFVNEALFDVPFTPKDTVLYSTDAMKTFKAGTVDEININDESQMLTIIDAATGEKISNVELHYVIPDPEGSVVSYVQSTFQSTSSNQPNIMTKAQLFAFGDASINESLLKESDFVEVKYIPAEESGNDYHEAVGYLDADTHIIVKKYLDDVKGATVDVLQGPKYSTEGNGRSWGKQYLISDVPSKFKIATEELMSYMM